MARVSPSQVVALIDRMVPGIETHDSAKTRALRITDTVRLALLVDMVERVPPELMPADAQKHTELISSVALIRSELQTRYTQGGGKAVDFDGILGDLHPFGLIRRAFAGLPDDVPSGETATLPFIDDPGLNASLRLDISWASSALRNREWKAATVLAGSVIEALLFWEIKQHPQGEVRELAIRKDDLDKWHLPQYIEAAGKFECVGKDTITGAQMAKDYRNLIHPGASERTGQVCDLGSAHHAVAALDHVVRDLTKQICPRHK